MKARVEMFFRKFENGMTTIRNDTFLDKKLRIFSAFMLRKRLEKGTGGNRAYPLQTNQEEKVKFN